jgi:fatty acid desaturase
MVSVVLYCAGLLLLIFARHPVMLPIAVIVFICGEVLMTPCFDETAKKHSGDKEMATCMGLLHLVDGAGRMIGAAFALAMYGWMRDSKYQGLYWPVVVAVYFTVCSALHVLAFAMARTGVQGADEPHGIAGAISASEAVALAEPQA